jgi:hypothetical protein
MPRMARHWWKVGTAAVSGLVLGGLLRVGEAGAQPVYKWTDERGVVHFSDSAPPKGTDYQVRKVAPAPAPAEQAPSADAAVDAGMIVPQEAAPPSAKKSGPPSLRITDQDEDAVGESTHEYRGTVKNVGGGKASDVVVLIRVTDSNQGAECVDEEVPVRPSELAAGETGTYSVEFTNPCYFGPTTASIRPAWDTGE